MRLTAQQTKEGINYLAAFVFIAALIFRLFKIIRFSYLACFLKTIEAILTIRLMHRAVFAIAITIAAASE